MFALWTCVPRRCAYVDEHWTRAAHPEGGTMATKLKISMNYVGPKSICACGHAGDGRGLADGAASGEAVSLHAGPFGHGSCMHGRCKCKKFTWDHHTQAFTRALVGAEDAT